MLHVNVCSVYDKGTICSVSFNKPKNNIRVVISCYLIYLVKRDRGKIYVEYINCYCIYFFSIRLKVFKF